MAINEGVPRRRAAFGWPVAFIAVAFLAGAVAGAVVSLFLNGEDGTPADAIALGRSSLTQNNAGLADDAVARTAAFALPAVVTVINEIAPSQEIPEGGLGGGAGVIIDERGYVLTNEHIVHFPGKLTVVMDDGELRSATLVSHDAPFTDLALLRIPSGGLKALAFGDSDDLVPGETVLAIGSPDVDYQNSVTVGVASGLHRRKRLGDIWLEDLIQTDAAINVGSSGGPLLNLAGEVVGMITFRDIGTGDPLFGISFALSSNSIQPIVRSIIEDGGFPRPYFGIEHRDIDEELLASSDLAVDQGALIDRVYDDSPAKIAGFRPGDVILRLGRTEIDRNNTFLNALAGVGPNDRVTVAAWRDGVVYDVTLELKPR